jgi:hypothetical protein
MKDTALSEHDRCAAWHVWITGKAWHAMCELAFTVPTQENAADLNFFVVRYYSRKSDDRLCPAQTSQGQLRTPQSRSVFKTPRKITDTSRVPLRFSGKVKWPLHEADHAFPFTAEVYIHITFTHENSFMFTLLVSPTKPHITVNTTSLQLNRH